MRRLDQTGPVSIGAIYRCLLGTLSMWELLNGMQCVEITAEETLSSMHLIFRQHFFAATNHFSAFSLISKAFGIDKDMQLAAILFYFELEALWRRLPLC